MILTALNSVVNYQPMNDETTLRDACREISELLEFHGISVEFTDYGFKLVLEEAEIELGPDDDVIAALRGE